MERSRQQPTPTVLFVAAMGGLGGPVKRLATLLRHLDGVHRVLVKPASPELDARIAEEGAVEEHVVVGRSAQRSAAGALAVAWAVLRETARRGRTVDVIHANGLVEFALAWPTAVLLRKPVVTWVGNYEPPRKLRQFRWLVRGVARRTRWHAVSSLAADVIVECGLAARDDVRVVTNIVDPADVRLADDESPPPHRAPSAPVTIGYLQVARPEKGFDLLPGIIERMRARALSPDRFAWLLFTSRTPDPAWAAIDALPDDARPQGRGRSADVRDVYAQCDVVLSPSRKESFNRVVAEAMTAGVPVVTSDLPPVREVVGDAALRFPPEDVDAAADALLRLVEDAALRARLSREGRERAARWQPRPVAATFEAVYAELAGRPPGGRAPGGRVPTEGPNA